MLVKVLPRNVHVKSDCGVRLVPGPGRTGVERILAPQGAHAVRGAARQQAHVVRLHHVGDGTAALGARQQPACCRTLLLALALRHQVEVGRARRLEVGEVGARREVRASGDVLRAAVAALDGERTRAGRCGRARRGGRRRRHQRSRLVVAALLPRRAALARPAPPHNLIL